MGRASRIFCRNVRWVVNEPRALPERADEVHPVTKVFGWNRIAFVVALLLLLGATSQGCRRSPEKDQEEEVVVPAVDPDVLRRELATETAIARLTDRSLDAYERATAALERAGEDCDAAAASLRSVVLRDGETIARAKLLSELPDLLARARPVLEQRKERTRKLTVRMDAATMQCSAHPGVARMLQHF